MVALPAVPKVVRVDHHMKFEGDQNMMIRNFFQYSGALSLTDAGTWLGVIMTAFNTFVTSTLSNRLTTTLHELTDLTSSSAPQVQNVTGVTGGDTNNPTAPGVALVIKSHIARRYRGGHPRVYIPGLGNANITTAGLWDSTFLATVVGHYQTYLATSVGGTIPGAIGTATHVNISYFSGFTNHTYPSGRVKPIPTPRVTPLIDTIDTTIGNPVPGSQRRRNEQP